MKKITLFILFWFTAFFVLAQETKSQLTTRFDVIRNETSTGGNTRARVANAYQELADGMIGVYPVVTTGTDTYVGSLLGLDAYSGRIVFVTFPANNTGASTLNINSLGAANVQKDVSGTWTALAANDILANKLYRLYHDGTRFQIDLGGAGSGYMVLADTQTNTGAKTFLDNTLLLRNVANTFSSRFSNTNTAARVYTLPDSVGTIALTSNLSGWLTGTLTGNVIINPDTDDTYSFTFSGGNLFSLLDFIARDVQFTSLDDIQFYATDGNITFTPTLGSVIFPASVVFASNTFTRIGGHNLTITTTGGTNVTLPTTGTLSTLAGSESLTNKSVNGVTLVNAGTSTLYLSQDGTYTAPSPRDYDIAEDDGITYAFGGDAGSIIRNNIAMASVTGGSYSAEVVSTSLIPNNSIVQITVHVNGINSDGSAGYGGTAVATFRKNNSGTLSLIGTSGGSIVEDLSGTPTAVLSVSSGIQLDVTISSGTFNHSAWGEYTLTTY